VTIFDELRQGVKNIEFLADPTTGEVRIGNPLISATSFIAGIIARLSRRYPRIAFHVVPGEPDTLRRELNERSVDLMFIRGSGLTEFGSIQRSMRNSVSKRSTTNHSSFWQARKIHGPGGVGSSLPNW